MLTAYKWLAVISTVVFFLAVLGIAYYSWLPTAIQSDRHATDLVNESASPEVEPTIRQFMFPDSISVFTFWLAIATIGLCVVAVIQINALNRQERIAAIAANAARQSAKVASDALIASRRPWVMVDVDIDKGEFAAGNGLSLTLKFSLQNKGNDPALYAFPDFAILSYRNHGPGFVRTELKRFCGAFKERQSRGGPNNGGFTIFPDQSRSISITTTMLQEAVDADIASTIVQKKSGPYTISPIIIGCVDYQFSSPREDHQTWFAYEIHDKGIPGYSLAGNLVLVTPGAVGDRLFLVPMLIDRDAFYAD